MKSEAQKLYEQANNLRYETVDPASALSLYKEIILKFPNAPQAVYARNQIDDLEKMVLVKENIPKQNVTNYLSDVVITTAPGIEGFHVTKTLEVITSECAFGMNLFRDMFAGVRDVFGGRSSAMQKVLRDARIMCLQELKNEAQSLGANAVIAARLDYSEFSGKGKAMLFLVASGTAVVVKKSQNEEM